VVLLGNPNTGKTTLFNRLSGLKAKTSNFPGTTQDARVGAVRGEGPGGRDVELIDLPGVYSLELDQSEALVCREVLAGRLAPRGERSGDPDAVLVVLDASNLARNLVFAGEVLRRRLPTVVALNMVDLAEKSGIEVDAAVLSERLGCPALPIGARSGIGVAGLMPAVRGAAIPNVTPPGTVEGLEEWAEAVYAAVAHPAGGDHGQDEGTLSEAARRHADATDRIDRWTMHPVAGPAILTLVMAGLFYAIFSLAQYPMHWIDVFFDLASGLVRGALPEGVLTDLLAEGVVRGVGATVIFVPQIALLFFLMSLLEDTGYLARGALLMDRLLRPFGLPGHAFVPLLGSHACALPGIMAARAIPDFRDRLATILVAPFMTCSARLPVYVLLTAVLFHGRPFLGALVFIGCYGVGIAAGLLSALVARRTILRGKSRPMVLELPTYKRPSLRTALITTADRGWTFLKNAGTNILAICVVLWWLGAYPKVAPPPEAGILRDAAPVARAAGMWAAGPVLQDAADRLEQRHAKRHSYVAGLGRAIQPVFAPLGYDWQLSVGVVSSFAAREVFVSTMAVVTTGAEEGEGVMEQVRSARRDGGGPVFTAAASGSLLVYYVLAMQCLPTLAVTAKEARGKRWAFLQLAWMSGLAYIAALVVFQVMRAMGLHEGAGAAGVAEATARPAGFVLPVTDWQFWLASGAALVCLVVVARMVLPRRWFPGGRKPVGRKVTLTIGGKPRE
jgi:ferrous iron transport protein B